MSDLDTQMNNLSECCEANKQHLALFVVCGHHTSTQYAKLLRRLSEKTLATITKFEEKLTRS